VREPKPGEPAEASPRRTSKSYNEDDVSGD
jgi:hypothetical protein